MKSNKIKDRNKTLFIVVEIIFAIYAVSLLYPFCFMLLNSFKGNGEFLENIYAFPQIWKVKNYSDVFVKYDFVSMFINSMIMTFSGTIVC